MNSVIVSAPEARLTSEPSRLRTASLPPWPSAPPAWCSHLHDGAAAGLHPPRPGWRWLFETWIKGAAPAPQAMSWATRAAAGSGVALPAGRRARTTHRSSTRQCSRDDRLGIATSRRPDHLRTLSEPSPQEGLAEPNDRFHICVTSASLRVELMPVAVRRVAELGL